jgi:hypothetical protein
VIPIVVGLSLVAGAVAFALPSDDLIPPEVRDAGRAGLPGMLQAIPERDLAFYGFADPQEFSRTTLGEPFRLYTLDPEEIIDFAEGHLGSMEERPTDHWLFPVICDGRPRTVLTVAFLDGNWQAIEIGGPNPAPEMRELALQWPAAQGYRLRYIQVFAGGTQFVQVANGESSDLVPLESTARALGLIAKDEIYDHPLVASHDVATALEPIVRAARAE